MSREASAARSDEDLAARAASGEARAFDALVSRYHARVYRLAYRLTGDADDASDVVQDAFLQVLRHLGSFRGESRFGTWLFRIATNAALMHRRAKSRRPAQSLDQFLPTFDSGGRHRGTPEALRVPAQAGDRLDREQLASLAMRAIGRLPDTYRTAFVLRDLEELPTEEVAKALGLRPATVRQRVHRARLMLRGYLGHVVEERS